MPTNKKIEGTKPIPVRVADRKTAMAALDKIRDRDAELLKRLAR